MQSVDGHTVVLFAGRYRLLAKLGAGGMGVVHSALDTKLDRTVAIKIMAGHLVSHPDALARFEREAKALAKVAHPGIVQAFDSDREGDQHFLVMEFVEGRSLVEVLRAVGRVAPTVAADYGHQTALALHHAHERGLINRDVKPQNLLVTGDGQVKVLDLGLARFALDHLGDAGLTREGTGMGTPDYMAPEQFSQAHRADARSDIYSLGCTLFQLMTGRVPFPGTSLAEKTRAHAEQDPPRIEELCPEAPVGLAMTVRRMLAKQPGERFQSMREVAEALAPYVAGSSISLPAIQRTKNWEGSQLSFHALSPSDTAPGGDTPVKTVTRSIPRRSRRRAIMAVAIAAVSLACVLGSLPFWMKPDRAPDGGANPASTGPDVPSDAAVLTASQSAEGGGMFRTIGEALKKASPGKTIQVVDDAVYVESLSLDDFDRHTGLTLEATRGATLQTPPGEQNAIRILGVPKVAIRGFQFSTGEGVPAPRDGQAPSFVLIKSKCPGVVLEDLRMKSPKSICGILMLNLGLVDDEAPIMVRRCQMMVGYSGIIVSGSAGIAVTGVCLHDNVFEGCGKGVSIELDCRRTSVAGNIFRGASLAGLEFRSLQPGASDILVANNTFHGGAAGIRIWSDPPHVELAKNQVAIRNNVLFGNGMADIVYVRADSSTVNPIADSRFLLDLWKFDHNWRDLAGKKLYKVTPLAPADHQLEGNEFVSLSSSNPDFLRPAETSQLAHSGAGKDDPSLPAYVGAIPPKGVTAWDWDKNLRARNRKP